MDSRPAPDSRGARSTWTVWGLDASVVVDDPAALGHARETAERELAQVTAACSRFEPDSELSRINSLPRPSGGTELSPLLAEFVGAALRVAADTQGAVDPTLGADLERLGYSTDLTGLPRDSGRSLQLRGVPADLRRTREPGWARTSLTGRTLRLPADLRLDLGATAKALAADRIAFRVAAETGTAVLVSLGGDIATAGPSARRWEVLIQDQDGDPAQQISIGSGTAVATSSTQKRRWMHAGVEQHHILDPRFGRPVRADWRSVTVAAPTCLAANALSTSAIVRGRAAASWMRSAGATARLVALDGSVVTTGAWPREAVAS